ncbi:G-protein coupled receptor moody-like [Centruroides sculpturatus]|uniref:G-protein coupled receptor moody-like n=1 Tax=Centruroides sculpturatus TaxID=218467 RepID=UPI000C6CF15E|nr:G-protein coupled receptor moody-like [Centruroides sculpturatus]
MATMELESPIVSNISKNLTDKVTLFQTYPSSLLHFATTCCITYTVFGVTGNLLTILALLKSPRLRNATSVFIINLCIVDGFYCSFTFPLAASTFIHKSWPYSDTLCKIYPMFRYSNVGLSLFTVIAITINRYVIIVHPKRYDKIYTKYNIAIIILSIWVGSFLLLTPTAFGAWGSFGFSYKVSTCTILERGGKSPKNFLYAMAFTLPSAVFIYCYTRIYLTVRRSERNLRRKYGLEQEKSKSYWSKLCCFGEKEEEIQMTSEEKRQKKKITKDLKLLRIILTIFIVFIICYFPVVFVKIFKKEKSLPVLNIFGYLCIYFTAIINPVIYVVMSKEYRKAYKVLFNCLNRKSVNTETNSSELTSGISK